MKQDQPLSVKAQIGQTTQIVLCRTCAESPGGPPLLGDDHLSKLRVLLPENCEIRTVACLSSCKTPVALALQAEGKATYLFSGVSPGEDTHDIAQTCKAYIAAPEGWIEDARVCGRLRFCLVGRVPPLTAPE